MDRRISRPKLLAAASLAMLVAIIACNLPGLPGGEAADPTLTAMSETLAARASAGEEEGGETSGELATAQAEATQQSLQIQQTRTAAVTAQAEQRSAQSTVAAPVVAELPSYGVDPDQGQLAWVHEPVTLEMDAYRSFDFANNYPQFVAKDFVMAADITWDTQYGTSGCGFMFRSNGDQDSPSQYMVIITRLGSGHAMFAAMAKGELANHRDFYAGSLDRSFSWENGSTNRLAVVGIGPLITIYTNGVKIGEVDTTKPPPVLVLPPAPIPPLDQANLDAVKLYQKNLEEYQQLVDQLKYNYDQAVKNYGKENAVFEQGFVALLAASESGHTRCQFDKAWLWLIEP